MILDTEQIGSADVIAVMERRQLSRLKQRFAPQLRGKRLACLDIPDAYQFGEPELVELLTQRFTRIEPLKPRPEARGQTLASRLGEMHDLPMTNDLDTYHTALAPEDRAICDALRAAITRALPDAEAKIWHAHPVWFLNGNPITGYSKLKGGVRLLFWSGQSFASSGLAPEGSFKAAEARYRSLADIDPKMLDQWLAEARKVQWDYKSIVRNKGRLDRLV